MPQPHITTRRRFICQGLGVIGVGSALPNFLVRSAMAGPDAERDQPVLVVVQLSGGNDGLATVVPYGDDAYAGHRPTLRPAPDDLLKINEYSALCPQLAPFKKLYDDNQLAIVQAVGYPNANKSHFTSMDIWHTADERFRRTPDKEPYGWIGRCHDTAFKDVINANLAIAVNMGEAPLAIRGRIHPGMSLKDPRSFQYMASGDDPARKMMYRKLNDPKSIDAQGPTALDFVTRTSTTANKASDVILSLISNTASDVTYPNTQLAQSLRMVSAMIKGKLSARVYYVSHGGFDTHAGQGPQHARLMTELGEAIAAFQADLQAQRNADRVLTMAFSEFGRRVKENGSKGTDHGTAAPMFLVGPKVKSGLYGDSPSLTDLDSGDLKYKIDFRSVYATVLDRWMKADSAAILGAKYEHIGFMA